MPAGTTITHGIGGDHIYGIVEKAASAKSRRAVPVTVLESGNSASARIVRALKKDQPVTSDDIEIPDSDLAQLLRRQEKILGNAT